MERRRPLQKAGAAGGGHQRTEDLVIFLALSLPIFSVSTALLTFIIVNAVTRH